MNYFEQTKNNLVSLIPWIQRGPKANFRDQKSHQQGWWVSVTTEQPSFRYYFGPFPEKGDAASLQGGFIQDLSGEGATNIESDISWCQPTEITTDLSLSSI